MRIAVVLAGALVLGSSLGVAALATGSAPSFAHARSYATGHGPWSVAIGDLNGDGKLDLATANINARTVSVLLNKGDGSFWVRRDYGARREPASVAIGDLNGDGNPDLAIANQGADRISVLLIPHSVAIGDLNGDGKPDLATANADATTVSVLLNRGDGTFQTRRDYAFAYSGSVAIGDLNGDGKLDLATANGADDLNSVSVLLNRGDGTFQARRDYATGAGPRSVAIGDLNGDGRRDVATANFGTGGADTVSVLLNRPGLCTVQDVKGQTLPAAKRTIARANCRVGKIHRAYSKRVKNGHVISQEPKFGTVLPGGSKVNLVVSRGRRHS